MPIVRSRSQSITINIPARSHLFEVTPELEGIIANVFEEYAEQKNDEQLKKEIKNSKKLDALISAVSASLA